jgi:enoyl-CoA hydratase/carnithine racemase
MSDLIIAEKKDNILRIEINRPEKKNAINNEMYSAIASAIAHGEQNPSIRVITLHGQKDFFTADNDLKNFQNPGTIDGSRPSQAFVRAISKAKKPLIAAVSGYAIGIGTTMLFHFDLVYAANSAKFQVPFVNLGLCPELGSTYLLPRMAGFQRAAELFFYGDFFSAEDALNIGLVTKIFPEEYLLNEVMKLAKRLALQPPAAVRLTKALLKSTVSPIIDDRIKTESWHFAQRLNSAEAKEAFDAFYERRKPDFSGFE